MNRRAVSRILAVATALALCGYVVADESPAPASPANSAPTVATATPPAADGRAAPPPAAPAAPAAADDARGAPEAKPPDAPAGARPSTQHFEPSEKVRPDFDVSFPVDI